MRAILASYAAFALAAQDPVGPTLPWGVHISYGHNPSTDITVMWSTRAAVASSIVTITPLDGGPSANVSGEIIPFSDAGNVQTLHRVRITGLEPATAYTYVVGDGQSAISQSFNFTTAPAQGDEWAPVLAIYGDMGISSNAKSTMPLLLADAAAGAIDVVLHIGDAAYDLESSNGATGDAFMVQIEPLAAHLPYMICPGNHESANDFYEYRMRLGAGMPAAASPSAGGNGTFSSFDVGRVHVAMVSSEVYFSVQPHSSGLVVEQKAWLAKDLAAVNRSSTPFVVLGLHQPFYCSANDDSDDCHKVASKVRLDLEGTIIAGGVDVVFGAHEHAYERNYPVGPQFAWDSNRTGPGAYVNPSRPIHILTGAAGCPEDEDAWQRTGNAFSALRINDYGYSRLHVPNATHLLLEYVDNVRGAVLDSVWIVKEQA